ncbi:hypothetical protein BN130_3945 [Cronobacter malonaticus 507]|nr:hypothetical protein BN130_3945 [Cronobacter malonaticus 507]
MAAVEAEITFTLELPGFARFSVFQAWLSITLLNDQRFFVDGREEIFRRTRVRHAEQTVIETNLNRQRMRRADPVDNAFDLAAVSRVFAQRFGIVGAVNGGDFTRVVFLHTLGFNDIRVTQTHFFTEHQTLVLLVGFFTEIRAIDPDFAAERHVAVAHFRFVRMVRHGHHFAVALRVVFDNQFHRIDNRHRARRVLVEIFANAGFQRGHFHGVILFGHADTLAEFTDGRGGITATAQAGNGRHTRIVPAFDMLIGDQQVQLTLGHHRIFQIQAREFVLARVNRNGDVIQHPVIQTTVVLELQRTERMGDAFQRIGDAVGEVVHRVDAPFVARLVMFGEFNAIQHRVTHHDKRRRHINFRAQARFALFKPTGTHFLKQRQVFFHTAIAERAVFARCGQRAAVFADLLRR